MKERPILFSGSMVKAILDGRKTQTRRVCKELSGTSVEGCYHRPDGLFIGTHLPVGIGQGVTNPFPCPHGSAGDRLWVRETFQAIYDPKREHTNVYENTTPPTPHFVVYRATDSPTNKELVWKPSIFMPRWASRITLEITGVRVERLQEIDPRDCIDEGVDFKKHECGCETCARSSKLCPATSSSLIMEYSEVWDSINGKKHPWASNPWVWVISFSKL